MFFFSYVYVIFFLSFLLMFAFCFCNSLFFSSYVFLPCILFLATFWLALLIYQLFSKKNSKLSKKNNLIKKYQGK